MRVGGFSFKNVFEADTTVPCLLWWLHMCLKMIKHEPSVCLSQTQSSHLCTGSWWPWDEESFSVDKHVFLSVLCENYILCFSLELMQICRHPETVGTPATLLLDIILWNFNLGYGGSSCIPPQCLPSAPCKAGFPSVSLSLSFAGCLPQLTHPRISLSNSSCQPLIVTRRQQAKPSPFHSSWKSQVIRATRSFWERELWQRFDFVSGKNLLVCTQRENIFQSFRFHGLSCFMW